MNQILMYVGVGFVVLMACLAVPGLKLFAEAIIKGLLDLVAVLLKHKGSFLVWFVKTLMGDHSRVFLHATTKRDTLDPTQAIRRKALGYDDPPET